MPTTCTWTRPRAASAECAGGKSCSIPEPREHRSPCRGFSCNVLQEKPALRKETEMASTIVKLGFAGMAAVVLSGPAVALDEIVAQRGWAQVDYTEAGKCRAEVRSNG